MAEKKSALAEFKDFVVQGNVIDLAVAVIIAQFFGAVIKDVVQFILQILAIPGKKGAGFQGLHFTVGGGNFQYGNLISDIITFVVVAAVVFFVVVRPVRLLLERRRRQAPDPESTERPCPACLSSIPKLASRCAFCTTEVPPMPEPVA
ncbi:MscL family protein [Acidiferrimicrobium sp. IK]|uniref:MscL family protein n=1 Tax=Acidiferrimicrobium sp. IK TaxID=2871700 RepID=UPI0021CB952E|nr:MscL family protein [Acidiferrimicrobium sp. IK]MCU4187438.1 MscL family protein [Acidiferrimicrobium sp. IK]